MVCEEGLTILHGSANIHEGETDLQKNQRVRPVSQSPDDPQHIPKEKKPEAPIPFELPLRGHHPGSDNCH
jgi:hypothetical protein